MRLRLRVKDLKSCEGENLLAFNDSSTRLCETIYLMISFEECINKRIVKMCFLVIPCKKKSVYNAILGRWFLGALDVVASTIHLKMKYHIILDESIVIPTKLCGAHLIHEIIWKNPFTSVITSKKGKRIIREQLTWLTST